VLDLVVAAALFYLIDGVGIVLWVRSLGRIWARRIRIVRQSRSSQAPA